MPPVNDVALFDRQREIMSALRETGSSALSDLFHSLGSYTDEKAWLDAAGPIVGALQDQAVSSQIAYLEARLGDQLKFDRSAVIDKAAVDLHEPFIAFANALDKGGEFTDAVTAGAARAAGIGESSVTWAQRSANSAADGHPRVHGWTRVTSAGACDWCEEVAQQVYHSADTASFGHLRCNCEPEPIIDGEDLGRQANEAQVTEQTWDLAPDDVRWGSSIPDGIDSYAASVSDSLASAAKEYTTGGYRGLNEALRLGADLTADEERLRTELDQLLRAAGELPEPRLVWRGIDLEGRAQATGAESVGLSSSQREALTFVKHADYAEETYKPGAVLRLDGYQSTSFSVDPALDASLSQDAPGLVFEILAREGAYLQPFTQYEDEAELLLGHAREYRVVGVIRDAEFERNSGDIVHRTIVQLEQL